MKTTGRDRGGVGGASPLVSKKGETTLPVFPLIVNINVSMSDTAALPVKKVKLTISPPAFAYIVIWKIALNAYGPKGGMDG